MTADLNQENLSENATTEDLGEAERRRKQEEIENYLKNLLGWGSDHGRVLRET